MPNKGSNAVPCRSLWNGILEPWPVGEPLKSAHFVRSICGSIPLWHGTLGLLNKLIKHDLLAKSIKFTRKIKLKKQIKDNAMISVMCL